MDKTAIGFLADVLYVKELLHYEEYEAIMNARNAADLEVIVDKLLRGEYSAYRKGEPTPKSKSANG